MIMRCTHRRTCTEKKDSHLWFFRSARAAFIGIFIVTHWHVISGTSSVTRHQWHVINDTSSVARHQWHVISDTSSVSLHQCHCISDTLSLTRRQCVSSNMCHQLSYITVLLTPICQHQQITTDAPLLVTRDGTLQKWQIMTDARYPT